MQIPAPAALVLLTAGALAAGPLAPPASAQCLGPDGLDGAACCAPASLTVPLPLPPATLPGQGICWDACGLAAQTCVTVGVGAPVPVASDCGRFTAPLTVDDCSGTGLLSGTLELDYTRTWSETPVAGAAIQVWRFLAKVDLAGSFTATPVCPVPTCLGPHPTAFWYGYLDYAFDCATGSFENALVLFHGCDAFQHDALLSSRPGVFHPQRSYAIVAPDTTSNPFVPSSVAVPSGTVVAEAVRTTAAPAPGSCAAEEPVVGGTLQPLASGCLCPLAFTPALQTASRLGGAGVCGSSFTTLNLWPTVPWIELVTTSIGAWTTSASYPGPERVAAGEGLFLYTDACTAAGVVQTYADLLYGALTTDGWTVLPDPAVLLTDRFVDLASNYALPLPGTPTYPVLGTVAPTEHLVYVNVF